MVKIIFSWYRGNTFQPFIQVNRFATVHSLNNRVENKNLIVPVCNVTFQSIGNINIFPSVIIKIGNKRSPAPFGFSHTGIVCYFAVGSISIIKLKRIAWILVIQAILQQQLKLIVVLIYSKQLFLPHRIFNCHIYNINIFMPIVINVINIRSHGGKTHVFYVRRKFIGESSILIIDKQKVGFIKIISNINIRPAISVNVSYGSA